MTSRFATKILACLTALLSISPRSQSRSAPPVEVAPPAGYPWPQAVAFLAGDCSLYRQAKRTQTIRDSLSATIFNPNHTRAYPEHDLPSPVKVGRRLMSLAPAKPGVSPKLLLDAGGGPSCRQRFPMTAVGYISAWWRRVRTFSISTASCPPEAGQSN